MRLCVRSCVRSCVRLCVRSCVRSCVRLCFESCVKLCARLCETSCVRYWDHVPRDLDALEAWLVTGDVHGGVQYVSQNVVFHYVLRHTYQVYIYYTYIVYSICTTAMIC